MIRLIYWIWCLPQQLVGLIYLLYKKSRKEVILSEKYKNSTIYYCKMGGGVSLGNKIFLDKTLLYDDFTKNHEYGHCKQSLILGWLYLLVIGLPSFIWANCFGKYRARTGKSYYWLYCEKWANKLGGVDSD